MPITGSSAGISHSTSGRSRQESQIGTSSSSQEIRLQEQLKTKLEDQARSLQAGSSCRAVEPNGLEEMAKHDIERSAQGLDVFTVIGAVKEAYPTPARDDAWFDHWIKTLTKEAFADPARLISSNSASVREFGDHGSVVNMLFRCMLETYADTVESLSQPNGSAPLDLRDGESHSISDSGGRPGDQGGESRVDKDNETNDHAGRMYTLPGSDAEVTGRASDSGVHEPMDDGEPEPASRARAAPKFKLGNGARNGMASTEEQAPSTLDLPRPAPEEAVPQEIAPASGQPFKVEDNDASAGIAQSSKKSKKKKEASSPLANLGICNTA
ncbi:uncharacterized protein P884DRAFT_273557 [Thermothelomyces heterothallicus CBS 202.75]|uniref:uncharacterized protein n=1 Tax=Thermothelomyces heterothallicus CBS 202.75 TaxID=1149848 RepID=UPI003742322D